MLTESQKKFQFGNTEPQQRRDYSGAGNTLEYEGYASPGTAETTAGWVIIKHTVNNDNADVQSQPKFGVIWTIRSMYNFNTP